MKKTSSEAGRAKILDAWIPPENAGDPVGCVATTFTFHSAFFEEECLSRFVRMQTDAVEDGPLYLIERDDKLAGLMCAAVLVDQHHCIGTRSLRWDLLPARVSRGILHAKVSLLCWSEMVRIIIASANLTESGYRRNLEVFGCLDFHKDSEIPVVCLNDTVSFLKEAVAQSGVDAAISPAVNRWNGFLDHVWKLAEHWGTKEPYGGKKETRVHTIFSGPSRPGVFEQLQNIWPDGSPPSWAHVVSPFFDPPEKENRPAKQIWNLLKQRGEIGVTYYVTAEEIPGEKAMLVRAPQSIMNSRPPNRPSEIATMRVLQQDDVDEVAGEFRQLHMKAICLKNEYWTLHMIGSSNFTSAALGLHNSRNVEANLVYCANENGNKQGFKNVEAAFPYTEDFDKDVELRWIPLPAEDLYPETEGSLLHPAFSEAVFVRNGDAAFVRLVFIGQPPAGWKILRAKDDFILYHEAQWIEAGKPNEVLLPWEDERPPDALRVSWDGSATAAWWPVNVQDSTTLPPPAELKNLPLDLFLRIYTSARPAYVLIADWLKRRQTTNGESGKAMLDPHKRVDTSGFLLQRTRRVSWAFAALRERLERPFPTRESLDWRLHGVVGVTAIADAIGRESHSAMEKNFLLAEMALELSRVQPRSSPGCLSPSTVKREIQAIIDELRAQASSSPQDLHPVLSDYIQQVFEEAQK